MNNDLSTITVQRMSSLEIAKLTNKSHSHVLRDIDKMLQALDLIDNPNVVYQQYQVVTCPQTKRTKSINLDKELSLTLVSGYNVKIRNTIIKRWQQLESQVVTPPKTALPPQYIRYLEHVRVVPVGHFCAMQLVYNGFIAKLSYVGHDLMGKMLPDGSFSKMYLAKLRKDGVNVDTFAKYPFKSQNSNFRGMAKAYPMQFYHDADKYLHEFWLPKHAPKYLDGRDKQALKQLPAAIPYLPSLSAEQLRLS